MKRHLYILFFLLILPTLSVQAQSLDAAGKVDSLLEAMSLEEKVGQLFMVAAYSNKDEKHQAYLETLVKNYGMGGVIVMQGGPERQKNLVQRLQAASKLPLLVDQDAEWGQAMRLDSTYKFPLGKD